MNNVAEITCVGWHVEMVPIASITVCQTTGGFTRAHTCPRCQKVTVRELVPDVATWYRAHGATYVARDPELDDPARTETWWEPLRVVAPDLLGQFRRTRLHAKYAIAEGAEQ